MTEWVRSVLLLPTAFLPTTGENGAPVPVAATEPDSIFDPLFLDDTYKGSHLLTMPLTLAPIRLDAGRNTGPSRFRYPLLTAEG